MTTAPPLRIGIVGAGYIADVVARAMSPLPQFQLAGVASRRPASALALAARHGKARVFDDVASLLASDGIDAVYCATPTAAREAVCVAAARAGKHVLAEKPFASAASLQAIAAACRAHGVTLMDATHFVWHPRMLRLQAERAERIGRLKAVNAQFFFPSMDPANIRLQPSQEPAGAFGDMAWYTLRALLAFAAPDAVLDSASGHLEHHPGTGAIVRASGVLRLSDGVTQLFDVGYNVGTLRMDLALLGETGTLVVDDFVLDWPDSAPILRPGLPARFKHRRGLEHPTPAQVIETPAPRPQVAEMLRAFSALCAAPQGVAAQASLALSERTQALLDGVLHRLQPARA